MTCHSSPVERALVLVNLLRSSKSARERSILCDALCKYLDFLCEVQTDSPLSSPRFSQIANDLSIELRQWIRDTRLTDCMWRWLESLIRRVSGDCTARVGFEVGILSGLFEVPIVTQHDPENLSNSLHLLRLLADRETAWAVINGYHDWLYDAPLDYKEQIGCPPTADGFTDMSPEEVCTVILAAIRYDVQRINDQLAQMGAPSLNINWSSLERWIMNELVPEIEQHSERKDDEREGKTETDASAC